MMLLFLFFLHMLHAYDAPSLKDITRDYISQNLDLQKQSVETASHSLDGFPTYAKRNVAATLVYRWSQEKKSFASNQLKGHEVKNITPAGQYLIVDCYYSIRKLFMLQNEVYQEVDTKNFSSALQHATQFAGNERYILMNSTISEGLGVVYDFSTQTLKQYGNANDLEICYLTCSLEKSNIFFIMRKGFGLYLEKLDMNTTEQDNASIVLAERLSVKNDLFGVTSEKFDNAAHAQFACSESYLIASDGKRYYSTDISCGASLCVTWSRNIELLAAGSKNHWAIKPADRNEIIIHQNRNINKFLSVNIDKHGPIKAITFVELPDTAIYIAFVLRNAQKSYTDILGFYDYKTHADAAFAAPFQIKKIWYYKDTLLMQTVDNEIVAYPSWFLESMVKLTAN